ncbi:Type IV secretion system protein PtlH [archaeon HR04]|nr:Type IV secretion system protein PtlH [archaeon HR04]
MNKEAENRSSGYNDNTTINRLIDIDKIASRLTTVFSKYKGIKTLSLLKNINNNKGYYRMVNNENYVVDYNYLRPRYSIVSIQHIELFNTTIYTAIVNDDTVKGGKRYVVIEPTLTAKDLKNLEFIKQVLLDELIIDISKVRNLSEGKEDELDELLLEVNKIAQRYDMKINRSLNKLKYYIVRDLLYLGKIEPLMHDHMIEEVNCDGPNIPVYIWHREYESLPTNIVFTEKELDSLVIKMAYLAGKHISLSLPILDASLNDGSRVNITFGKEITRKGSTFTIRRFRADPITIIDLIQFKTMTSQLCAYLWYCAEKGMTMLIAGGTASGKTVLLNAIASLIPPNNKIVSIEDTAEINLPHENWIQSVSRQSFIGQSSNEITLFDLLRAALRQRPDIIIVGETRGREAYTLFQAMATGHGGLSTIHGDSVDAVISRLVSPPMNVPLQLIASSLDMIILQMIFKNKEGRSIRRVTQIAEINGINDDNSLGYVDSFVYDANTDEQIYTGKNVVLDKIAKRFGLDEKTINNNIMIRRYILDWLAMKGIRRFNEVNKYISEFYTNPRILYERLMIS